MPGCCNEREERYGLGGCTYVSEIPYGDFVDGESGSLEAASTVSLFIVELNRLILMLSWLAPVH